MNPPAIDFWLNSNSPANSLKHKTTREWIEALDSEIVNKSALMTDNQFNWLPAGV